MVPWNLNEAMAFRFGDWTPQSSAEHMKKWMPRDEYDLHRPHILEDFYP